MMKLGFLILLLLVVSLHGGAVEGKSNNATSQSYNYDNYDVGNDVSVHDKGSGEGSGEDGAGFVDQEDYDTDDYSYPDDYEEKIVKTTRMKNTGETNFTWFSCDRDLLIARDRVCDGVIDCFDCSDESNCSSSSTNNLFFCYSQDLQERLFNETDPKCISRNYFCDGIEHCLNGADEVYGGFGPKCRIKNQQRSCLLPQQMLCDYHIDCHDNSDHCDAINETRSDPEIYFQCIGNPEVSIFRSQVCDDVIDCPDMTDECLCRHKGSAINKLCASVCWNQIWRGGLREPCGECQAGEMLVEGKEAAECEQVDRVCSNQTKNVCRKEIEVSVVQCIGLEDGEMRMIEARLCDGRPECYFGDDECVSQCGELPGFCDLLVPNFGFVCQNQTADDVMAKTIRPCNGEPECPNSTDEIFCPQRKFCTINGVIDPAHVHTYDVRQKCDGILDCPNGGDEECSAVRNRSCDHNGCDDSCPQLYDCDGTEEHFSYSTEQVNYGLQLFVLVLSAFGLVGNFYGFLLAVINSIRVTHGNGNYVTYFRELVVFTTISTSRFMVCACFAFILLRHKDHTCLERFMWRSGNWCDVNGVTILVAITTPLLVLAIFATVLLRKSNRDKGQSSRSTKLIKALTILTFTWLPVTLMVYFLTTGFRTHAWVQFGGFPDTLFGNLFDRMSAVIFSERVVNNSSSTPMTQFTWEGFSDVITTNAPNLKMSVLGYFGFYSSSEFCLPQFLVDPRFNSNPWNVFSAFYISLITVLVIYCTICFALLARHQCDVGEIETSRRSYFFLCVFEIISWLVFISIFFIKINRTNSIPPIASQSIVLVVFALNYGLASVILHAWLRKLCPPMNIDSVGKGCSSSPSKLEVTSHVSNV